MTLSNTQKLAKHIFRLLKVSDVIIPIGRTNKGNFGLRFSENNDDFEMYLDAVPLSIKNSLEDENNIELKKMIEKYMFDSSGVTQFVNNTPYIPNVPTRSTFETFNPEVVSSDAVLTEEKFEKATDVKIVKPRGRPAGSKNKTK